MDLSDLDPNLFLNSIVIRLDIGNRLLSRLNGLYRLDVSPVLLPVPVIVAVIEAFLAGLVITGLSVLVISAVLVVAAVLASFRAVAVLAVRIIPVPVTVPVTVSVILSAVLAVRAVSAVIRRCRC